MAGATKSSAPPGAALRQLTAAAVVVLQVVAVLFACRSAFEIRTFAIKEYGRIIHECVHLPKRRVQHALGHRHGNGPRAVGHCTSCLC